MESVSGQIVFVVWREAFEAILVIGIIYAFLKKTSSTRGLRYMWSGVLLGVLSSLLLGYVLLHAEDYLQGTMLTYFESSILVISAILMTQMVFWMNKNGRHLKREIEQSIQTATEKLDQRSGLIGISIVAMLSIAREGAETVIYLYSIALQGQIVLSSVVVSSLLAFALAIGMAMALAKGFRYLKSHYFFKVTSVVLLVSASGLLAGAVGKLVQENHLPGVIEPLWDASGWIKIENTFMKLAASIVGYNPRPSLMEVGLYCFYWFVVYQMFNQNLLRKRSYEIL